MREAYFDSIRLFPGAEAPRRGLLAAPLPLPATRPDGWGELVEAMVAARQVGAARVAFFGSDVLGEGLQPAIVRLLEQGWLTHVATTGAGVQYDVEAALWCGIIEEQQGPDLARAGMWREVGEVVLGAVDEGARSESGFGASLGGWIAKRPAIFPRRDLSAVHAAHRLGVPYTVHVTFGADDVHTHPGIDFAALGTVAGLDFKIFCRSLADLGGGGVFLHFASAVTGVEVFLKALSIVRNLGHRIEG